MKVFLSHQRADSSIAAAIASRLLRHHQIESYLDVVDINLNETAGHLGDYLRREMGACTQLLAVVSASTKESQWVPWEIGVATEKDFPLATYCGDQTYPPEFLQKWPYLRSMADVDQYAVASRLAAQRFDLTKSYLAEDSARRSSTEQFFVTLRKNLGQ